MNMKSSDNFDTNGASKAFGRNITTIYGLNLALSYENAAVDRLQQRLSQCTVPKVKKNLERHLRQTMEQQDRLRQRIEVLAVSSTTISSTSAEGNDVYAALASSYADTMKPTDENGRLPIPEPPASLKAVMDAVGSDSERDVWESVNDLIVERAEAIMYRAGIDALRLLEADKKTIDVLRKNLKEELAFAKWLEKNNPRIAKKLMKKQMREGKRKKKLTDTTTATIEREGEKKERESNISDTTKSATATAART